MNRADLIEAMARAISVRAKCCPFDVCLQQMCDCRKDAEAALNAIGIVAAVVPRGTTPIVLQAGWAAINEGRSKPVDMSPGPALAEADLTIAPVVERVMEDDGA